MVDTKPTREDESKVVLSKLPRDEFFNFKKLCDAEDKTVNKKIRELIKLEVDEKLGGIYKSKYDLEKIKFFQSKTIEDYNSNSTVEKICKVNLVDKTDKTFIQIGLRPLVDEEILLPDKGGVHFHPELPGLGMDVAVGEKIFLINNLLKNKEIEVINFKEEVKEFPKHIYGFNDATILISLKFFIELSKELMHRIEYKDGQTILDSRYKLIFIPEKILDNKIVIVDKNAILWEKQKFFNKFTEKDETLDIKIEPAIDWKVDITVRSVNKIRDVDSELIKILEVGE